MNNTEQGTKIMLTDVEIDGLTGVELSIAVATQIGWGDVRTGSQPDRLHGTAADGCRESMPMFHVNKGAILSLLLVLPNVEIIWTDDLLTISKWFSADSCWIVEQGPKSEIASLCCKAFLKLVNRNH